MIKTTLKCILNVFYTLVRNNTLQKQNSSKLTNAWKKMMVLTAFFKTIVRDKTLVFLDQCSVNTSLVFGAFKAWILARTGSYLLLLLCEQTALHYEGQSDEWKVLQIIMIYALVGHSQDRVYFPVGLTLSKTPASLMALNSFVES